MEKDEAMKKCIKIVCIILLALLLLLGGLCIWQRDKVRALYLYLTTDAESIAANTEQVRAQNHAALVDRFPDTITVTPPTIEQSEALLDGKVKPEEVKESLGIAQAEKPADAAEPAPAPEGQSSAAAQTPKPDPEELVNQCVAELYACKVDVMAQLGVLKQAALDQWSALSQEQRTKTKKTEIIMDGLRQCYDLEADVDAQVQEILDRYRTALQEAGGDATVTDTLWNAYCQEKETEMAYYLNKYMN